MEEQCLVEGDNCFTILYKSSIIHDKNQPELKVGSQISYLWPENALHRKTYKGKIIAISGKFI